MAEIVNLRQARKRHARAEATRAAEANRASHGRTKAERQATNADQAKAAQRLDGHRREPDLDPPRS